MAAPFALLALTWSRDKDPRLPLGHASLIAALDAAGIDVHAACHAVNPLAPSPEALATELLEAAGAEGDVGVGVYVWNEAIVQRLLPCLRGAGFRGRIILGGPQVSYAEPGVEALYPDADVFVRGYAEDALVEVLRAVAPTAIPGVHWRGTADRATTATPDLGRLPSPWLGGTVPIGPHAYVRMETQRGCPFRCTFCQHREAGARLSRRDLDHDRVRRELALFVERRVADLSVLDPIFNLGPRSVEVLETLRASGFAGRLSLQCRFESVSDGFLDACADLDVTLEFGLQTIHPVEAAIIDRRNRMTRVEEVMSRLDRRGVRYLVSLIFGLPEQTLASFGESVDFCLRRRVPVVRAFPLMLLRGTPLARDRARWGLVESDDVIPMVVGARTFGRGEWTEMARLSDALRASEGRHPDTVAALASREGVPDLARWAPARVVT